MTPAALAWALASGSAQVAVTAPFALLAALGVLAGAGLLYLAVYWLLRWHERRTRIDGLVILPPGEQLGDDVIDLIRRARADDRAEAVADELTQRRQRKQGGGRG